MVLIYLGLHSTKSAFIPDERLLCCKSCGVILLRNKMESHYGALAFRHFTIFI